MTLLNTVSNFGGTWPRYFVLESVEYFTVNTCSIHDLNGSSLDCKDSLSKAFCLEKGGKCIMEQDGYYLINTICISIGILLLLGYISREVKRLQSLSVSVWRLKERRID